MTIQRTATLAAVGFASAMLLPSHAHAQFEEEQQEAFFFLLSPGFSAISFDQFDDQGGTRELLEVTLTLDAVIEAEVGLTNMSPDPTQIMVDPTDTTVAVTELLLANLAPLDTLVINIDQMISCGFDLAPGESCDFGGPLEFPGSDSKGSTNPADLAQFVGGGTVGGDINGVGNFQYTGSILFNLAVPVHQAMGTATLTYRFEDPTVCCFNDGTTCQDLEGDICNTMGGTVIDGSCADGDCPVVDCPSVDTDKGSLLIFSKIEIRWADAGGGNFDVVQDTFVDITNDWPQDTRVQMYFVNGDAPLEAESGERAHLGWNWVDNEITLTKNEPTYWSALTGAPKGVSPFTVLDPTGEGGPGRPDPSGSGDRVLRGYIVAWATDMITNAEVKWNHLKGDVTIVNYRDPSACEYLAWAFEAPAPALNTGDELGTPGMLMIGSEYACAYSHLLLDFYAVGSPALSGGNPFSFITVDTSLTLFPVSADLQQETAGPVTTKAHMDVWNMNEVKFSGAHRCVTCWDCGLLSQQGIPNHFMLQNLQTDKGKARIDGLGSQLCPDSVDAAILGIQTKHLDFNFGARRDASCMNLIGMGQEDALIKYDVLDPPPPAAAPSAEPQLRQRLRGVNDLVN